jgi:hypothetical protein
MNKWTIKRGRAALFLTVVGCLFSTTLATADPVVRQATGPNAAAIQAAVDAFRSDLGPNNGTTAGSQLTGRREISWDAGGAGATAQTFPPDMFTFAGRGAVFESFGTGFQISGQPSPEFGNLNPAYPTLFNAFSSPRLFTPLDSNTMVVSFIVPSGIDTTAASVTGFGAVFTDVDIEGSTFMTFFSRDGAIMHEVEVPAAPGDGNLSFVGVSFDEGELIGFVLIKSGNTALGLQGPNETGDRDLVVMDDFIYGEPVPHEGITIAPSTARLFRQGAFDIVVSLEGAPAAPVSGRVLLNGSDVTAAFIACVTQTQQTTGSGSLACALPRGFLAPGEYTLQVQVTLSDGTTLRNSATWFVSNAVP